MTISSHSAHHDDQQDAGLTSPTPLAIERQSAALLALGNDREKQESYLRSKQFSYNDLPEWLRSECFSLTRPFYENHATDILTTSLYTMAVKLSNDRIMRAGKFLIPLRSPTKSQPPIPKKQLAHEVETAGPFALTQEIYDQLGLSKASNLYDLLKMSNVSIADYRTPEAIEKKIEGALVRSGYNVLRVPPFMPPFTPVTGTPYAQHATEAYDIIAGRIIAFHLVTDIVASHHLPLQQEHIQKIVHEVTDNPFEDLAASSRLRFLVAYSEHYDRFPTCTSLISRDEALTIFAFNRRPLSELNSEEVFLHQQQRAREEAKLLQSQPAPARATPTPLAPVVDEHREVILKHARSESSESAIIHLQRAARFHDVTPLELERLLRLNDGNIDATIAALKINPQSKDPLEQPDQSEPSSKVERTLQPFTFVAHRAEHGFTKWFNGLSDDEQTRVRDTLKNVARRCTGITKAVKGGQYRGLYEVRVMDCQLRIYFRFIPGMRIVLLTGGGKGDSRTGQQLDLDRAARYRDEYDHCMADTDLSDSSFDPEK